MARLGKINIAGFRAFANFDATVENLQVLVGANGSGKTTLFQFLRFLRDGMSAEIPYQVIEGWPGQNVFHGFNKGTEEFRWTLEVVPDWSAAHAIRYRGTLLGPLGKPVIADEAISFKSGQADWEVLASAQKGQGFQSELKQNHEKLTDKFVRVPLSLGSRQLILSQMNRSSDGDLKKLRDYVADWTFYETQQLALNLMRRPILLSPGHRLEEDGSNLSSVLLYLMTDHPAVFSDLQLFLRLIVPGFESLAVKHRGGNGEVIATWKERDHPNELSLADLSDGTLKLLCWMVLCLQPDPPSLICIDEPDQGLHPRAQGLLADLFDQASMRTQIFLATHSSYFMSQFALENIAVLRKENGGAVFCRAGDSAALQDILQDFGAAEIENMHRSNELEVLA